MLTTFVFLNIKISGAFLELAALLCGSILIFFLGIINGLLNWKNFLITLLCIELMYFGVLTSFLFVGDLYEDLKGQIYGLSILILAAGESAVGLGILIVLYRFGKSIDLLNHNKLHI